MARTGRARRLNGFFHVGALSVSSVQGVADFNGDAASFAGVGAERVAGTGAFVTAEATFSAFGKITGTGAFTAAKATFSGSANIGVAPTFTIDRQGRRVVQFPLPSTAWTVDGIPVSMHEASWSTAWDGGYDQMRGRLTEADMDRAGLVQGTLVRGYTTDGAIVFEGRISTPPEISDGMAAIGAQGIRVKAEHKVERLFIQSRSMDIWAATNAEPHLDGTGGSVYGDNSKIAVDQQGGIVWRLDRNVDVINDRENGLICYLEGVEIKRVAYHGHWDANDDENDLSIRLYRADGPVGASVLINDVPCTAGNRNEAKDQTFAVTDDAALLMLHTHADLTPADVLRYQAQRIRVNSEVCTDDEFTGSEIVDYIGTTIGWDTTRVEATTENALPFDWDEGSWADALTYVAETDDRYWRVVAGDKLEYADWGTTTWTAYLSRGTNADLTPEEVFNEVWVWYDTPNGVRRRVRITPCRYRPHRPPGRPERLRVRDERPPAQRRPGHAGGPTAAGPGDRAQALRDADVLHAVRRVRSLTAVCGHGRG